MAEKQRLSKKLQEYNEKVLRLNEEEEKINHYLKCLEEELSNLLTSKTEIAFSLSLSGISNIINKLISDKLLAFPESFEELIQKLKIHDITRKEFVKQISFVQDFLEDRVQTKKDELNKTALTLSVELLEIPDTEAALLILKPLKESSN